MGQRLSDRLREAGYMAKDFAILSAKYALGSWLLYSFVSNNGYFDSERTKKAAKDSNPENRVKTVMAVEETWHDDSLMALIGGGNGYNPLVIRRAAFEDGTVATLTYRTLAWQPFRRWLDGEEFNPKPGEQYEVSPGNRMVRQLQ